MGMRMLHSSLPGSMRKLSAAFFSPRLDNGNHEVNEAAGNCGTRGVPEAGHAPLDLGAKVKERAASCTGKQHNAQNESLYKRVEQISFVAPVSEQPLRMANCARR